MENYIKRTRFARGRIFLFLCHSDNILVSFFFLRGFPPRKIQGGFFSAKENKTKRFFIFIFLLFKSVSLIDSLPVSGLHQILHISDQFGRSKGSDVSGCMNEVESKFAAVMTNLEILTYNPYNV